MGVRVLAPLPEHASSISFLVIRGGWQVSRASCLGPQRFSFPYIFLEVGVNLGPPRRKFYDPHRGAVLFQC